MKKAEAITVRDTNRQVLIGKRFERGNNEWFIRDVIVANRANVAKIYCLMWDNKLSNETALSKFAIDDDGYEVFVISHQWNFGSGSLLFDAIESYHKANPT